MELPEDFLLGVSTASYQIEGATSEDGRGESIWDRFARTPGNTEHGDTGAVACDHYHRFREDVGLLARARIGAYRFSVAWPRVVPAGRGSVNEHGLDFYDRLVDQLLEAGVEPWPCLFHWDLPQALQEQGGFSNRDTAGWFCDYASAVVRRLGDRTRTVLLLNEPGIFAVFGHLLGLHAPGLRSLDACLAAAHHLNLAAGLGAEALRSLQGDLIIGSALALNVVEPASDRDEDVEAAERVEALLHRAFLEPALEGRYPELVDELVKPWIADGDLELCRGALDLIGVNYYTRILVEHRREAPLLEGWIAEPPRRAPLTEMGWEIYPSGLEERLCLLAQDWPDVPLYVTENGAAFEDEPTAAGTISDPDRIGYLEAHIAACLDALARGADVRGYFVWSLLDNFEWADGYSKRFGLVWVDFETQERLPKDSYRWYAEVAQTRRIPG